MYNMYNMYMLLLHVVCHMYMYMLYMLCMYMWGGVCIERTRNGSRAAPKFLDPGA